MKNMTQKKAKAENKAKAKVAAKVTAKVGRKAAKLAVLTTVFATVALCGCSTAKSDQPAKSATMNNEIHDSVVVVAAKARIPMKGSTNAVIEVEGGTLPTIEVGTITQSLESSGTETYSPSATQTPTTDVKPDVDVRYNDAIAGASSASKGILESLGSVLTDTSKASLLSMVESKSTGTVTLDKKDGTKTVVTCENGQCTACADCEVKQ